MKRRLKLYICRNYRAILLFHAARRDVSTARPMAVDSQNSRRLLYSESIKVSPNVPSPAFSADGACGNAECESPNRLRCSLIFTSWSPILRRAAFATAIRRFFVGHFGGIGSIPRFRRACRGRNIRGRRVGRLPPFVRIPPLGR